MSQDNRTEPDRKLERDRQSSCAVRPTGAQAIVALVALIDPDSLFIRILGAVFGGRFGLGAALSGRLPGAASQAGWVPVVMLWLVIGTALVTLAAVRRRGRA